MQPLPVDIPRVIQGYLTSDQSCRAAINYYARANSQYCTERTHWHASNDLYRPTEEELDNIPVESWDSKPCVDAEYLTGMCHFKYKCRVTSDYRGCTQDFLQRGLLGNFYGHCTGWERFLWIDGIPPSSKAICVTKREHLARQGHDTTEADEETMLRDQLRMEQLTISFDLRDAKAAEAAYERVARCAELEYDALKGTQKFNPVWGTFDYDSEPDYGV